MHLFYYNYIIYLNIIIIYLIIYFYIYLFKYNLLKYFFIYFNNNNINYLFDLIYFYICTLFLSTQALPCAPWFETPDLVYSSFSICVSVSLIQTLD